MTNLTDLSADATPGPWNIEDSTICNRELEDTRWDSNEDGNPSWDVAEVYAPANAAFIVASVNIVRKMLLTESGRRAIGEHEG